MKQEIYRRVQLLRQWMKEHKLQAYIITSSDPHASEYTPLHWQFRQWISGFNGSAATVVVTADKAALWTDSRYFLAAETALAGTPFALMKDGIEGTPTIAEWLQKEMKAGEVVGVDGQVLAYQEAEVLRKNLQKNGISLVADYSAQNEIWADRPPLPMTSLRIQPIELAGETVQSKLQRVSHAIRKTTGLPPVAHPCLLVNQLDDIAWLLNLRGSDVHCNPVFVAYCIVGIVGGGAATLYCDKAKITPEVAEYLNENGVKVRDYNAVIDDALYAAEWDDELAFVITPQTNVMMAHVLRHLGMGGNGQDVINNPIPAMKARKNEAEQRGMKQAMLQDGVALVKWWRWLEEAVPSGEETEMSIDAKLTQFRSEWADFDGLSFDTIAAYGEHGAIVHYEATPETDVRLEQSGLLLIDTGAQYTCGTTDITRTILLGDEATLEEKKVYTLVLKGHIALSRLKFPRGASGTQLDLAARQAMWREGYNYGHGTGHGVGSHLCVHEGPHQIRMNYVDAPISEGMTVTDEPGIYLAGRFGVRIENVLLCVPYKETEFGTFVGFEPLTLCPIDLRPIDWTLMTAEEVKWLNDYHAAVQEKLLPLLDDVRDREWLKRRCKIIEIKDGNN